MTIDKTLQKQSLKVALLLFENQFYPISVMIFKLVLIRKLRYIL